MPNIFDQFTGKYALSKTLRFELRPVGKTKAFLKQHDIVETDEQIDKDYHQMVKPLLDELHRKFVSESLENYQLPQESLEKFYDDYKNLNESKKLNEQNVKRISESVRRLLIAQFVSTAKAWKKRYGDIKFTSDDWHILTDKAVISLVKKEHPGKAQELKKFDRFFTYFSKFNQTRENLYASDGEATAIATRLIDENLSFFVSNILLFESKYKNVLSEIPELKSKLEIFILSHFSKCLLQTGIEQYRLEIGKINKAINLWRQQKASEDREFKKKKKEYKLFVPLYRQILAEYTTEETEWDVREDGQVTSRVWFLIKITGAASKRAKEDFFGDFIDNFENGAWDIERIYIPRRALNTIIGKWFESRETIGSAIADICGTKKARKKKNSDEDEFVVKLPSFISLDQIKQAIEKLEEGGAIIWRQNLTREQEENKAISYDEFVGSKKGLNAFLAIFAREFDSSIEKFNNSVAEIQCNLPENAEYNKGKTEQKEAIVALIHAALSVYQVFKYFHPYKGKDDDSQGADNPDDEFYGVYNDIRVNDNFDSVVDRFFALRSHLARKDYLQRKPWSRRDIELKWKLNFDKPTLLTGWSETGGDRKAQYRGYILRKNGEYYLAISTYDCYLSRTKYPEIEAKDGEHCYEKLEYKQLNWGKNIAGGQVYTSYTKQKLGEKIKFQKHKETLAENEHAKFLLELIKDKYLKRYSELQILFDGKQYNSPKELQSEFNKIKIGGVDFVPIHASRIDDQEISIGKKKKKPHRIFLFRLTTNSLRSKHPSVHSSYWNALFKKTNTDEKSGKLLIDLGANAELFFRPATPNYKQEKIQTHSGKIIGKNYTEKRKKYIHKERYTEDKYFFHCPIMLNAQAPSVPSKKASKLGLIKRFNEMAIENIYAKSDELTVLGLDRGEKHLIYYSLIKQDGTVIDYGSFNEIEHGSNKKVDYLAKLVVREAERDLARKDLRKIEGIKELKEGYLSHVVHKIAKLVLQYKAIVVLENLDKGFKRGRFKIERQTYQKFERALIQKFNFLVDDKNSDQGIIGSVFNGYQLTAPFESFKTIGKQSGILFYTAAGYTSKTDPVTGWRPHVYVGWSDANKKIKSVFEKFHTIGWDEQRQAWIFSYNAKDFVEDGPDKIWELVADDSLTRLRRERNQLGYWGSEEMKLKVLLDWIFEEKQWGLKKFTNMKGMIWKLDKEGNISKKCSFPNSGKEGNFWQWLAYAWTLTCQIRNSKPDRYKKDPSKQKNEKGEFVIPLLDANGKLVIEEKGEDYILSPVLMPNGEHFDSRKGFQGNEWNGDANGAYNIARKGIILIKRIKQHPAKVEQFLQKYQNNPLYTFSEDKSGNYIAANKQNKEEKYQIHKIQPNLFISNSDWDAAAQDWDKFVQ